MGIIELKQNKSHKTYWTDQGSYIFPDNATNFVITDTSRLGIGTNDPCSLLELWD